jgi:hypothetical protein
LKFDWLTKPKSAVEFLKFSVELYEKG